MPACTCSCLSFHLSIYLSFTSKHTHSCYAHAGTFARVCSHILAHATCSLSAPVCKLPLLYQNATTGALCSFDPFTGLLVPLARPQCSAHVIPRKFPHSQTLVGKRGCYVLGTVLTSDGIETNLVTTDCYALGLCAPCSDPFLLCCRHDRQPNVMLDVHHRCVSQDVYLLHTLLDLVPTLGTCNARV
jgi:hypothetical protein